MEYERYKSERNIRIEVGSRWRLRLSGALLLRRCLPAIIALADQVDAVNAQLQVRLAFMLARGQLAANCDLLTLLEIPRERSLGLLSPNAAVNPDGLLLVTIACGHGHRESANSRASGLPHFCIAAQVASQ